MAQKTLLQIVQTVASELNLPRPTEVLTSQNENVLKLAALVRAVCDDLLAEHDWQVLQTRYTFTTTSGDDTYAFPTGIKRFVNGTFFDTTNRWPLRGPLTPTEWEWMLTTQISTSPFERFRVFGDQINLYPVPGATPITFVFDYVSSYYVRDGNTSALKADFEQDSDICLFDHRLVIYGVKLKFLASVSQDTTQALVDFQRALDFAKGQDAPAPRLSLAGGRRVPLLSTANFPDGSWS